MKGVKWMEDWPGLYHCLRVLAWLPVPGGKKWWCWVPHDGGDGDGGDDGEAALPHSDVGVDVTYTACYAQHPHSHHNHIQHHSC